MAFSIEKYLEEHNLSTSDKIIKHIQELKRSTIPNIGLITILEGTGMRSYEKHMEIKKSTHSPHLDNSYSFLEKFYCGNTGIKDSQNQEKAPIFTYCKVNKHALEALAMRALHGHKKYEKGDDWENFSRVPNGDFEYSNSMFRHALGIGEDTEEEHLISTAWNAIARLEIFFRNKEQNK